MQDEEGGGQVARPLGVGAAADVRGEQEGRGEGHERQAEQPVARLAAPDQVAAHDEPDEQVERPGPGRPGETVGARPPAATSRAVCASQPTRTPQMASRPAHAGLADVARIARRPPRRSRAPPARRGAQTPGVLCSLASSASSASSRSSRATLSAMMHEVDEHGRERRRGTPPRAYFSPELTPGSSRSSRTALRRCRLPASSKRVERGGEGQHPGEADAEGRGTSRRTSARPSRVNDHRVDAAASRAGWRGS